MERVVVIGLDGAPFEVVKRWAEEGILPNLQRLIKEGCFGPLLSSNIPETPIAWTSILTGKNPGKHGVFGWAERAKGSYGIEISSSTSSREPPVWEIIGREGKSVGIFNVPLTYPPKEVNGFLVSGFDTPSTKVCFTWPASLSEEILSRIEDYVFFVREGFTRGLEEAYVESLLDSLRTKEEASLYLLNRYKTDFSFHVFMELDHLHHKLWRLMEGVPEKKALVQRVYRRMDETVGKLLDRFDEETTFLFVSDHGAGSLEGVMYINKWLMEQGWLTLKGNLSLYLKSFISRSELIPKAYRLVSRVGLGRLKHLLPRTLQRNLATSFVSLEDIDWEATKAYAHGEYGQIFVNLKGREPHGTVAAGKDYDLLVEEIRQGLLKLAHPKTGGRMVREVYRREDLFHGPMMEKAPDLIFAIDEFRYNSSVKFGLGAKGVFGPPEFEDSGTHRREGILIASGRSIKKGSQIQGAALVDIAPTLLHLMGLSIPEDMDGKVLDGLLDEDWKRDHPPQFIGKESKQEPSEADEKISSEEMEIVKKRLQSLGYLD